MTTGSTDPQSAVLAALGEIKGSVAAIAAGQVELTKTVGKLEAKVERIDENLNGDGSLDDPGIAGTVRSLKAWKERDEPTVAALKDWKTAATGPVKLAMQYGGGPLGAVLGLVLGALGFHQGGGPPAPPGLK